MALALSVVKKQLKKITCNQFLLILILISCRFVHLPINPDDPPGVQQPKQNYQYRTVGCLFNHKSFFANSQVTSPIHIGFLI